ncbi:ABC transporter permease [Edaphobacter albus]|uniref:ABC transporter permease n=1 Tax=Edaphobacter sp. 4G125 TaxID=2763071 RepID=UPI00210237A7|nr:ABC transporter permease [Edaphobacter sp. 4G125]
MSAGRESFLDFLRRAMAQTGAFFHKEPLDRELDAEIASHIEMATDENIRNGMTPEEARRKAMVKFGGVEQARERQRESRGLPWLETVLQDLRYTMRTLGRDRGFATVSILILALGIGANVVVFSVVNTILLRPLPFYDPSRLVWIAPADAKGLSASTYSVDAYEDLRLMNKSYEDVTGYFAFSTEDNYKLTGRGVPLPATGIMVAGNFFHVLGVEPMLGRQFTPEESIKGGPAAVMLSYPFWQRQFGGDRSIVGKTIAMDNKPVTVAGILPESFDFGAAFSPGAKVDVLTPLIMDDIRYEGNTIAIIGRLKQGVTLAQARSEAKTLFPQFYWGKRFADSKGNYTAQPIFLKDYISGKLRRSLIVLWSAVGMILLIVCVNLSNLLLARAAARSKEFALRSALGAARGRLIRQLLTESLVLAGGGAALGLGLAYGLLQYLAHQGSIALPLLSSVKLDGTALAWTLLISVSTAILFGLMPGIRASRTNVQEALKDGGHGTTEGRQHEKMRTALVISEVALACVLLVGAGLLLRSFLHVLDVDLGFQPSRAAAVRVDYDDGGSTEKRSAILQNIADRVGGLPGIDAVGFSDNLPLDRNRSWGAPRIKGKTYKPGELPGAFVYIVSPGYLRAMGMRLRGRDFTWQDNDKSEGAVILNESAAKGLWPNEDAVGKMAVIGNKDVRVIGVIADVRDTSVEGKVGWQMYLPMMEKDWGPDGAVLVVRSRLPPEQLASSVMRTLREINPNQAAVEFRPMQRLVDHAVSPRQFFMLLVGIFAGLGLLLASLGIYGVISYSVTRRTQEIGVRMALGASPENVQMGVLAKTLRMTAIGIVVGAIASLAVANLIASLLFGTKPTDPMTFVAMAVALGIVAALAGYLPARRASRINPMVALRNE